MVLGDGATVLNAAADWNDNDFSFEYWPGTWNTPTDYTDGARLFDIVDFKDYNNMSLKFEICIPASGAWQAGAMQLIFAGTDKVTTGNGRHRYLWRCCCSPEQHILPGRWLESWPVDSLERDRGISYRRQMGYCELTH